MHCRDYSGRSGEEAGIQVRGVQALPRTSSLSAAGQSEVLAPHAGRRVIAGGCHLLVLSGVLRGRVWQRKALIS